MKRKNLKNYILQPLKMWQSCKQAHSRLHIAQLCWADVSLWHLHACLLAGEIQRRGHELLAELNINCEKACSFKLMNEHPDLYYYWLAAGN